MDARQLPPLLAVLRGHRIEILRVHRVAIRQQHHQLGDVFLVIAVEGFLSPIAERNPGYRLQGGEFLGVRAHHIVILVGLHQPQRPQQLPLGWVVSSLQRIQPFQADHLRHEGLGRFRRSGRGFRFGRGRLRGALHKRRAQQEHREGQQGRHDYQSLHQFPIAVNARRCLRVMHHPRQHQPRR